jgi:hypothetical protein
MRALISLMISTMLQIGPPIWGVEHAMAGEDHLSNLELVAALMTISAGLRPEASCS